MMLSFLSPLKARVTNVLPQRLPRSLSAPRQEAKYESFSVLCCFDQKLILFSAHVSLLDVKFVDCISIDLPSHLIGDKCVENPGEVSQIILDLLAAINVKNQPFLLALSSSKFSYVTFASESLSSFSLSDRDVLARSPFLASDSLVEIREIPSVQSSGPQLCGVTYASESHIRSWQDVLSRLDLPIVGVSPIFAGSLDWLPDFRTSSNSLVFCDCEENVCNLLLKGEDSRIHFHQLPFGSSLYKGQVARLDGQFFARLNGSVEFLIAEHGLKSNARKIITGYGLDFLDVSRMPQDSHWVLMSELCHKVCKISPGSESDGSLDRYHQLYPQLMSLLYSYCCP